jgi:dTDP-4-amino-4,6-dideoxygalactose transaminase
MAALLSGIGAGEEVIVPSFTFVSTANVFATRGAKVVFADVMEETPNIDANRIEELISGKTKAIILVHYAGMACQMDKILDIARKHQLIVIEDAAHAIESKFQGKQLGTLGDYGAFSFHETKNVMCGEGGLCMINKGEDAERAEIIWEKGTNRAAFHRGEVSKYQWVDIGSSFLPSDIMASILYAQLMKIGKIQEMRLGVWNKYHERLKPLEEKGLVQLPVIPGYAENNGHMFYLVTENREQRDKLIFHLNVNGVMAATHYLPLHSSMYYRDKHDGRELPNTDRFSECLLRLPFYNLLSDEQIDFVSEKVNYFYS